MSDDFYEIDTPATESPVTLDEVREWVKMDDDITEDNALLSALIPAAVTEGEDFTNRCFMSRTFTGYFGSVKLSNCEVHPFIQIRRAPLLSITIVELLIADVWTEVTDYERKKKSTFDRLIFKNSSAYSDADDVPYPLRMTFVAGYGVAAAVPDLLKTAIKEYIFYWYANRGDTAPEEKKGMPSAVKTMFKRFRIINTFG